MKTRIALFVLMLSTALMSFGQSRVKVTGKVTDDSGEALIGVSITAKGENNGVTTDFEGNYQIETNAGTTLVYSYIGYDPAERRVTQAGVINVTLRESSTALNDVVVVGYGVQKKSSVTETRRHPEPHDCQPPERAARQDRRCAGGDDIKRSRLVADDTCARLFV